MKGRKMSDMNEVGAGCLVMIFMLVIAACIGGFCVDYVTNVCWGKDLPMWADCCIGIIGSQFAVPAAIICVIVEACDVETPFWGSTVVPVAAPVTQPAQ